MVPAIDSSHATWVVSGVGDSRTCRCTAFAPEDTPVQVISRPGSTTAKRDRILDLPLDHTKRVSTAVGASISTSWMPGAHVGHAAGSLNSCHTVATGASMSTVRDV